MISWETLHPGILVNATLDCTTHPTTVTDQVHPLTATAHLDGRRCAVAYHQKDVLCHTHIKLPKNGQRNEKWSLRRWSDQAHMGRTEQVWSVNATPHNPQDSKDSQPTPWCQKPQDNPRGPVSMPHWVRAKFHLSWDFHGWDLVQHVPKVAWSDLDLGNLEARPMPWTFCPNRLTIGECLCHEGVYYCNSACLDGWCMSKWPRHEFQDPRFPAEHWI